MEYVDETYMFWYKMMYLIGSYITSKNDDRKEIDIDDIWKYIDEDEEALKKIFNGYWIMYTIGSMKRGDESK